MIGGELVVNKTSRTYISLCRILIFCLLYAVWWGLILRQLIILEKFLRDLTFLVTLQMRSNQRRVLPSKYSPWWWTFSHTWYDYSEALIFQGLVEIHVFLGYFYRGDRNLVFLRLLSSVRQFEDSCFWSLIDTLG